MSAIGYARCEDDDDASKARHDMREYCYSSGDCYLGDFRFDMPSGKVGLIRTLRALRPGDTLLVRHLSNLGRSLHEVLKNANELLTERGVDIVVVSTGLEFNAGADMPDTRALAALFNAHNHYTQENVRRGVEAARMGGAVIGRPARADLKPERVAKVITGLRNAKAGRLPSVRETAKRLACGLRKASELLKDYKAKEEANGQAESATA